MGPKIALNLTLVIDIGKSNAKLLMLDEAGAVVERHSCANAGVQSPLGYLALDVRGLETWMKKTLQSSSNAKSCGHVIASTHGAAYVALTDRGLAWDPIDYEFEMPLAGGFVTSDVDAEGHSFDDTLSPDLPAGLNAARQLSWMQKKHPEAWRSTRQILPYPQYWAWLLSGVACSEVSSFGCHTHLWSPARAKYSNLAVAKGWATLFAPMRSAWEVLGPVQAHVAMEWGLPKECLVHVGVHDSNACLVCYFDARFAGGGQALAFTLVSSGTWTVLLAPGASSDSLKAENDMLGNVDVTGCVTPTARFMGGREFATILGDANPHAANFETLQDLVNTRTLALPAFVRQRGPFGDRVGTIEREGHPLSRKDINSFTEAEAATLAAIYCAQVTAWLIRFLWSNNTTESAKVVVEGPFAHNPIYMSVLQSILPNSACYSSAEILEGTARGAWLLTRWSVNTVQHKLKPVRYKDLAGLVQYHEYWLKRVNTAYDDSDTQPASIKTNGMATEAGSQIALR